MINFHCIIIPVLDSIITHTSAWFLDSEIHQLVKKHFHCWDIPTSSKKDAIFGHSELCK